MLSLWSTVDLGVMSMKGWCASPKLQHCWNLTIRLFIVISSPPVGGVLPLNRDAVGVFYSPSWLGQLMEEEKHINTILFVQFLRMWKLVKMNNGLNVPINFFVLVEKSDSTRIFEKSLALRTRERLFLIPVNERKIIEKHVLHLLLLGFTVPM